LNIKVNIFIPLKQIVYGYDQRIKGSRSSLSQRSRLGSHQDREAEEIAEILMTHWLLAEAAVCPVNQVLADAAVPEKMAALQGHNAMGAFGLPGREANRTAVLLVDPA